MTMTAVPFTLGNRTIVLRARVCQSCADAVEAQPGPTERKSEWQRRCPTLFQRELPPALRAQPWAADVLGWTYGPQGLLVVGDTGAGKTWAMWWLLRRLLDERRRLVTLDAVTFRSGLSNAAREGETAEYVGKLVRADVLYWDDFGQTHLSGAASEMLLHLVEQRTSWERPLLFTSQYSGNALEAQFEWPEMGAAVRRRLNNYCRLIIASGL
jgi:DNA replication protein DnaC